MLGAVETQSKETAFPNNLQPNCRQSTAMEAAAHGEEKEKKKSGRTPIKSAQLCAWLDSPHYSWLVVFLDKFFIA